MMPKKNHDHRYEESSHLSVNRLTYVEQQLLSLIGELNIGETRTEAAIKNQVRRHGLASRMRAIIRDCEDEVPVYNSPLLRGDLAQDAEASVSRSSSRSKKAPAIPPVPPLPSPLFAAKPTMKRSVSVSVSDSGHSGRGHVGHMSGGHANGYGQQGKGGRVLRPNIAPLSIDKVVMRPFVLRSPFSSSTPVSPSPSGLSPGHYKLFKSNSTGTKTTRAAAVNGKGKMYRKSDRNKPLPPLPTDATPTPTPTTGGFGFEDKPLPQLIPSVVLRTLAARTTIVSDRARRVLTVVADVIDAFDHPLVVDRELREFAEKQSLGRVLFGNYEETVDRVETNTSLKAAFEMRDKQHSLGRSASRSSAPSGPPTKAGGTLGHRRRRSNPKENRAVVVIQSPGNSDDEEKNVGLYSPRNASKDGFQGRTCTGQARSKN